ncbi:hypothetical protein AAAC51_06360 [Priestia megaterium]
MTGNTEETKKKAKTTAKSIHFNKSLPYENELFEYCKGIKNFSNYVKFLIHKDMKENNYRAPNPYDLDFRSRMEEPVQVSQSKKIPVQVTNTAKPVNAVKPADDYTRQLLEEAEVEQTATLETDEYDYEEQQVETDQQEVQEEIQEKIVEKKVDTQPKKNTREAGAQAFLQGFKDKR